jgi:Uma2 family endonuclease
MIVMEAPHSSHRAGDVESWSTASPDDDDARALQELEELFWTLDYGPRHRVELLEGRIAVSPKPAYWHERVVIWLIRAFDPVCEANGWQPTAGADLPLLPTGDIVEPDYLIVKDPEAFSNERSMVPADEVLLVAEICSRSSLRADREVKPMSCAKAGIPFYVLVDRFTKPMSLTLMSEPGSAGYVRAERVTAGTGGGKLNIPAPFGMTIDASKVPELLPWKGKAGAADADK